MKSRTEEDYKELADDMGWEFLGPMPDSVREPTWWRCDNGHRVDVSYDNLRRPGRGCKYCSEHWEKGEADYGVLADIHGLDIVKMADSPRKLSQWRVRSDGRFICSTFKTLIQRGSTVDGEKLDVRAEYRKRINEIITKA